MTRSLILPYLFVILAISYLGGTVIARKLEHKSIVKVITVLDERLLLQQQTSFLEPYLLIIVLVALMLLFFKWKKARGFILIIAALQAVFFGLGSSFLLEQNLKFYAYAIWWFPFQLAIAFLLLVFAAKLSPPFFLKTTGKLDKNNRPLILILILILLLKIIESNIYPFMIK